MLELKPMIHKFRMKDNYYCLDVNSGIIHVIDELIDRVLDIYNGTNRDAVHAALDRSEERRVGKMGRGRWWRGC